MCSFVTVFRFGLSNEMKWNYFISLLRPTSIILKAFVYFPDRSIIMWKLTRDETNYGTPQRSLRGHSHFVSDVVISSDGQFALSGAWDGTLRLWDLTT